MHSICFGVIALVIVSCDSRAVEDEYLVTRQTILDAERIMSLGGTMQLSPEEQLANDILMKWKFKEIDEWYQNSQQFNLSRHYFTYRDDIKQSQVYKFIRKMPKGAVLHVHSSMMSGSDYLIQLTYEKDLYVCFGDRGIQLRFSDKLPQRPCTRQWQLMTEARNASQNIEQFDLELKKHFTMITDVDSCTESDINTIWKKFEGTFDVMSGLLNYKPIQEKYFYDALRNFYDDKIMYVEIRTGFHKLYEIDGTVLEQMESPRLYQRIAQKFMNDHPDFIGVKLIISKHRLTDEKGIRSALAVTAQVRKEMPEMLAGFDLIGQEDKGKPLIEFLPALREAQNDNINFFFHGGETNAFGVPSDENVLDAILLGSKRIGHGYSLIKHPVLLEIVKAKDIAIEVNVISNSVLALVKDVRNHPLSLYLAMGLPVVLSSDDPGAWDADPLSHDFFVAFMGVASRKDDLRTLKKLAENSLKYSALDYDGKKKALFLFEKQWDQFIRDVISGALEIE